MAYDLFLFDLDDTLLDFRGSEQLSFARTMEMVGLAEHSALVLPTYQAVNHGLWQRFEKGEVSKDHLRVERWRTTFAQHALDADAERASTHYLELLPETVLLNDHAAELCEWLSHRGEIGIVTNGIQEVQQRRIKNSPLAPYISFLCVSDACGYAKPDVRFFEHSRTLAKRFTKESAIVVGDRMETDILGAHHFGVHSCWFNPAKAARPEGPAPTYEIGHLSEFRKFI